MEKNVQRSDSNKARTFTCFFVNGNVAAFTMTVSRIIANPYEYGK
jgi:hypothetical protein